MAVKKFYGKIRYEGYWSIHEAQEHVCMALKNIFQSVAKTSTVPFNFTDTPEHCSNLSWFMQRYPLEISDSDRRKLTRGANRYDKDVNELEQIFSPGHIPHDVALNEGYQARPYQLVAGDVVAHQGHLLLADDMGLGKTLSSMICMIRRGTYPVAVVVQAHLPKQWQAAIEQYTNLRVHIIKQTKLYDLPQADVYLISYSKLSSWVDLFARRFFKGAVFDEIQELRINKSEKYFAAGKLSRNVDWVLGMSGTPIYNYGGEIFHVMEIIKPASLGSFEEFKREWTDGGEKARVINPQGLGTYLREKGLMLRRTRADVGREMPPTNKLIYNVAYNQKVADATEALAHQLAIQATSGSFIERGAATRKLDALARHTTGVAKAAGVAAFVRILLENGRKVLLGGWHRDVYDIWMEHLAEFNPVMYTGTESPSAKNAALEQFKDGDCQVLIMSLRSGSGVDGLQHFCYTVVHGEMDWSPKVHDQFTCRIDRDEQPNPVDAFYLIVEEGSDPVIMEINGIKASQAHGIVDPLLAAGEQHSDETRMQLLVKHYLDKRKRQREDQPELFS